jgi:hypothetical protein
MPFLACERMCARSVPRPSLLCLRLVTTPPSPSPGCPSAQRSGFTTRLYTATDLCRSTHKTRTPAPRGPPTAAAAAADGHHAHCTQCKRAAKARHRLELLPATGGRADVAHAVATHRLTRAAHESASRTPSSTHATMPSHSCSAEAASLVEASNGAVPFLMRSLLSPSCYAWHARPV